MQLTRTEPQSAMQQFLNQHEPTSSTSVKLKTSQLFCRNKPAALLQQNAVSLTSAEGVLHSIFIEAIPITLVLERQQIPPSRHHHHENHLLQWIASLKAS